MTSLEPRIREAFAQHVRVSDELLTVELVDGRSVSVPISWYPRLVHATAEERGKWRLIGRGEGIHWPELDEDIRVEALLAGLGSAESQASLDRWLTGRKAAG
jgi:hypothetical protein